MNAQSPPSTFRKPQTTGHPTLEQRLRFIDLTFECFNAAKAEETAANGPIYPSPFDDGPSERSKSIGRRTSELRLEAMEREGLPLSLLCKADLAKLREGHRAFVRMEGKRA